MIIFFSLLLTFTCFWLIAEVVTWRSDGNYHLIRGNRYKLLIKELEDSKINSIDNGIISLRSNTILKGDYIAHTKISILLPYYVATNNYNICYGVLIFSKAYFTIKREFKKNEQKKQHIPK